jgi:hypothetical protein
MDQILNIKKSIFYLLFLFIGISIGFIIGNTSKPESKVQTVDVNYDSICLRTLKQYYLEQDQANKNKLIKNAAKQLAIDRMTNN